MRRAWIGWRGILETPESLAAVIKDILREKLGDRPSQYVLAPRPSTIRWDR
jgi:hypothetical protein